MGNPLQGFDVKSKFKRLGPDVDVERAYAAIKTVASGFT